MAGQIPVSFGTEDRFARRTQSDLRYRLPETTEEQITAVQEWIWPEGSARP